MRVHRGEGPVIRVGHRGAAALAAENSLAALEAAIGHGVDVVEFDVRDLADGPLVLAHSDDLFEVSGGVLDGTVRERSYAELRDAVPLVPTLDEALTLLAAADVGVHVDLKVRRRVREVPEALRRHGLEERAVVSSTDRVALDELRTAAPALALGLSYPEDRYGVSRRRVLQPAVRMGTLALRASIARRLPAMIARGRPDVLMLHHAVVSPSALRRAHALGVAVWAWTVDAPEELERLTAAGVDGVITNDPGIFEDR